MSDSAVTRSARARISGPGLVLVIVYAILFLAATGRSFYQMATRFDDAPLAYLLSALAALVYGVATVALLTGRNRLAWATIGFELVGVLVVGTLSLLAPGTLGMDSASPLGGQATVWSAYGAGYVFVPLVLPVLGLVWLARQRQALKGGAA